MVFLNSCFLVYFSLVSANREVFTHFILLPSLTGSKNRGREPSGHQNPRATHQAGHKSPVCFTSAGENSLNYALDLLIRTGPSRVRKVIPLTLPQAALAHLSPPDAAGEFGGTRSLGYGFAGRQPAPNLLHGFAELPLSGKVKARQNKRSLAASPEGYAKKFSCTEEIS